MRSAAYLTLLQHATGINGLVTIYTALAGDCGSSRIAVGDLLLGGTSYSLNFAQYQRWSLY